MSEKPTVGSMPVSEYVPQATEFTEDEIRSLEAEYDNELSLIPSEGGTEGSQRLTTRDLEHSSE